MNTRTTIAAIALIAAGATVPAFADDGDSRRAATLLEQARDFGKREVTGQAAGDIVAEREQRRNADTTLNASEQRWEKILQRGSLGR